MPSGVYSRKTIEGRFWAKVNKTETCWLWLACTNHGYGYFGFQGRNKRAHRLAYEWANGKIPDGLTLDHLCRVRHCIRPDHLEVVTNKENILRGLAARKNLISG